MGSNMAEQHPVGFQWVIEAKERGAKVIHVDPRFTRTSAMADLHVPLRAGHRHRVPRRGDQLHLRARRVVQRVRRHYTNARVIIKPTSSATPRSSAASSPGWDPEDGAYDIDSWGYAGTDERTGRQASSRPMSQATRRTARTG